MTGMGRFSAQLKKGCPKYESFRQKFTAFEIVSLKELKETVMQNALVAVKIKSKKKLLKIEGLK